MKILLFIFYSVIFVVTALLIGWGFNSIRVVKYYNSIHFPEGTYSWGLVASLVYVFLFFFVMHKRRK